MPLPSDSHGVSVVHPETNPGSQTALRKLNQQRIIDTLAEGGPATQAELARHTGLSTATISNIVKLMVASGSVETERITSSGRRALSVRLSHNGAVALGLDFGRRHLRVVLSSRGYQVLAERFVELPIGHEAAEGISRAAEVITEILQECSVSRSAVLGVGVGIPGPIDRRAGTVAPGSILPQWVGMDLRSLDQSFNFPVSIDNDANLGALAEVTWGEAAKASNLVFIKIGSGIGAGLILNGAPFYGHLGLTGEIGHATISEQGSICTCGNRGCLETVASTSVMMELLSRGGRDVHSAADIVRHAVSGDSATLRVIDDAGAIIGRALAGVANLLNPEVIVVGGPLAGLGDILLKPIHRGLLRHAVPIIGESTRLVMSSLGDRAEALGAASLVLQRQGIRIN
ncbi:MAG: ROK family transcriptional regulator [Microbacteriaceae bacterium]|nr:ROK family transcriptional regulator [Microbacteriaceae bacterium]